MATWNTDKPSVGNQITADISDIEENFQELHDVIEAITNGTLGTTTAANFEVNSLADGTTGFASTTCQPFYQNSAPTGWTRKTDLTDLSMFTYAASGNVATGGSSAPATHTHTGPSHTHTVTPENASAQMVGGGGYSVATPSQVTSGAGGTGNTGAADSYYIEMILATVD